MFLRNFGNNLHDCTTSYPEDNYPIFQRRENVKYNTVAYYDKLYCFGTVRSLVKVNVIVTSQVTKGITFKKARGFYCFL